MTNILVVTSSIDYTVDYLIQNYSQNVRFFRFNVDMFGKYKIDITSSNWLIDTGVWSVCSDDVFSIYYRKPMLPDLSEYEIEYRSLIQKDIISVVTGLVDSFEGIVLTKPAILRMCENKTYQLQTVKKSRFNIPESLITNNLEYANKFINKSNTIIKPITTGKIITNDCFEIYQTNKIELLEDDIDVTPVYLQNYIEKLYEVRLTVVNDVFYGVKIESSNKLDWRDEQAKNIYTILETPDHIKQKCLNLLDLLGLKFGAFDFIVTPDEEWIYLEVNPNGQWLWLEQALNLNISYEIIKYLGGEK